VSPVLCIEVSGKRGDAGGDESADGGVDGKSTGSVVEAFEPPSWSSEPAVSSPSTATFASEDCMLGLPRATSGEPVAGKYSRSGALSGKQIC